MEYIDRLEQAKSIHRQGQQRVRETPAPEGQKFPVGAFVKIADNLGMHMSHFTAGVPAQVDHTYSHAYPASDGFGSPDYTSYCLLIRERDGFWTTVAWYDERQLELITDSDQIAVFKKEIQTQRDLEAESNETLS